MRNCMRNRRRGLFGDEFVDDQNILTDCLRFAIQFVISAALTFVIIIILTCTPLYKGWGVFMLCASIVILLVISYVVYMYLRKISIGPYDNMDQDVHYTREENRHDRVASPAGTSPGVKGSDAEGEYVTGGTTRTVPTTPPITPSAPSSYHVYANPMSSDD